MRVMIPMTLQISKFPKQLLDDINKGKCIPIIGAGFSKNAVLGSGSIPLWNDIGKLFAAELDLDYDGNPIDIISNYVHKYKRSVLVEKLREMLHINEAKPGKAHISFANLYFKIILTTNFDNLLEKSFEILKKPYHVITSEYQLASNYSDKATLIIKMHGDLNHPNKLVTTEKDYDLYFENNPLMTTYITGLLINRTPLFIGYSMNDPDLRQLIKMIHLRLGSFRRPAYALGIKLGRSEILRFQRREIEIINIM